MAAKTAAHRQTISLPAKTARRVQALARSRHASASRVLRDLVETGLEQADGQRRDFMALVESYRLASDPAEAKRLGDLWGRVIFG